MKTVYMHQLYMGTVGDMKNLEQHYSDMASKGWLIDKIGLFTHRYRAVEPCKVHFFVDFLPQITAFDYPENEDAQDYRRICEDAGWNFIAANKQFHVFCADDKNPTPIPIHTDNSIHAKIYLRASRKYELPWLLYAVLMFCLFSPLSRGINLLLSNILLFMTIGYSLFLIGYTQYLFHSLRVDAQHDIYRRFLYRLFSSHMKYYLHHRPTLLTVNTIGYTSLNARFCHASICGMILSVTLLTISALVSNP